MFARRTKATGAAQSINERRAHLHQERRSRSLRQLKRLPKEKAHEGPLGMDASSVTAPTGSTEPTEPRRCNPSFHIPPPRPFPAAPSPAAARGPAALFPFPAPRSWPHRRACNQRTAAAADGGPGPPPLPPVLTMPPAAPGGPRRAPAGRHRLQETAVTGGEGGHREGSAAPVPLSSNAMRRGVQPSRPARSSAAWLSSVPSGGQRCGGRTEGRR